VHMHTLQRERGERGERQTRLQTKLLAAICDAGVDRREVRVEKIDIADTEQKTRRRPSGIVSDIPHSSYPKVRMSSNLLRARNAECSAVRRSHGATASSAPTAPRRSLPAPDRQTEELLCGGDQHHY
jgi:hypothetical protein